MDKNTIVSESYNRAVEAGFNSYLEQNATAENCEIKVDEEKLIAEIEDKWLNKELAEIGNITPGDYINSLSTLDELIEFFINIASVSDIGVPDILMERLEKYGKSAADKLFDFVKKTLGSSDKKGYLAVPQAVYAVGCLRYDEYKLKLIELLIDICNDEMIAEAVCAAIVEYNQDIIDDLIKTFHASEQNEVREHVLSCVAEIAREYKSDEIFNFLKNAFRVLSNIKLTLEILGDYGDGRAIPLLRGYIVKNINEMDKNTFNHIRAIIKKLGGEINDLEPV